MSVINTNITSMIGQQNLNASKSALTTSMERLSSGLRINSAKDDAAGQAIANRMSAQITGLSQSQRNANDGISIAQTAEGALNQVNDNLQRIRELSVQAQNGTNSVEDKESIQAEISQRLAEIDRVSEETNFNGVKVLSETIAPISIQVGANDGESISVNLETINSSTLNLSSFDVTQTLEEVSAGDAKFFSGAVSFTKADMQNAANTGAALSNTEIDPAATGTLTITDEMGTDFTEADFEIRKYDDKLYAVGTANGADGKVFEVSSTDVVSNNLTVTIGDEVTGELASSAGEKGTEFSFDTSSGGDANDKMSLVTSDGGSTYHVRSEDANGNVAYYSATVAKSDANGVVQVTISDNTDDSAALEATKTLDPLKQLDDALSKVDSLRSDLGAIQNRFDSAITNLSTTETNLSAARSRIEDADYATEVANMTRAQILQQAGTSVLAQANQVPQGVLSLLG
ncbi:FliC/FljB family flagellin [Halomonas cupida]|uniref:FliC/FljB family flagellin n=1 Tax=Halomonas TaxID=2745 RepID=UPI001A8EF5DC|nr:FliC/FljB family flagellin [Halomonas litopenaei]MBN8412620.1 FliC/FljB family flagellin [Halomonas litopenaei]